MLLEMYDWGYEARTLQVLFGLGLGLVFGIAAQITRFCLRRAVAGDTGERGTAAAVWITAFATALASFQVAQHFVYIDLVYVDFFCILCVYLVKNIYIIHITGLKCAFYCSDVYYKITNVHF